MRATLARRPGAVAAALVAVTLACTAITIALFDRSFPLLDAGPGIDRAAALARARAFVQAERLAPPGARTAVSFDTDEELSTYVDLAAGGPDSLRALARGRDVALSSWTVRFFVPGSAREVSVRLAPDGRLVGVRRTLAQDDRRPRIDTVEARRVADATLTRWGTRSLAAWRAVGTSYVTQPRSGRVDHTVTYERVGRRIGSAPLRLSVVVTGAEAARGATATTTAAVGAPLAVREYVEIPERWKRRYGEMRSANDLYANLTLPGMLLYVVLAIAALLRLRARGLLRMRPAMLVGGTIGLLLGAAALNGLPGAWSGYDTAQPPGVFVGTIVVGALLGAVGSGVFVAGMVAAAEGLTRLAFPRQWDWYAHWRLRGTRQIAMRVLWGYALCAFGFAYVTLFYLATRHGLGWWVPTSALDDPNLIATPLPWVGAIGMSLFAGVWEECAFRAIPLALLSLWVGDRPGRRWWMMAGVIVTALVFGFGHANYPSWPAYSRGVELFLDAALWAVLYLTIGLPATILAHVAYDLAWFGMFAFSGTTLAYRVTLAIVLLAFVFPLLAVLQRWFAQGGRFHDAPEDGRLGAWRPAARARAVPDPEPAPRAAATVVPRWRETALALTVVGLVLAALLPPRRQYGPAFTASRTRVRAVADSTLRARGVDPARWRLLLATESEGLTATTRRFFDRTRARDKALMLATSYLPVAWWEARYVRTGESLETRGEEWRIRVRPDGALLDVAQRIPEARPGGRPTPADARRAAWTGLRTLMPAEARVNEARPVLREVEFEQTPRPARLDTRVELEDTRMWLPAGASARVRVTVTGDTARAVTRHVELPESFLRRDRGEQATRAISAGLGALVVLAVAGWLLWQAMHRPEHPEVGSDARLDRPALLRLGAASAALLLLLQAQGWPGALQGWETDVPWSTFLTQTAMSIVLQALVMAVGIVGLWYLGDGIRRRAGVPLWPSGDQGAADALVAGSVLGIGPTIVPALTRLFGERGWPQVPGTTQDVLVPWLHDAGGALLAPFTAPMAAAVAGALVLGARTTRGRFIAVALMVGGLVPVVLLSRGAGTDPLRMVVMVAVGLCSIVLFVALLRRYGRHSALAWVHAALFSTIVSQLERARGARHAMDTTAALVGLLAAVALCVLLHRRARGHARIPASTR